MSEGGPTQEGASREQELLREIAALRARVAELEARDRVPPPPPQLAPQAEPSPVSMIASMEPVPRAPESASSAEQFVGRRVVPFVGAIAVLGAIGFLVHYAIEIGLIGKIPPEVRFAIGVALGLGLLAAGELVRRRGAPGAAMGLDAAGVGAVMVSVALGVFSLRIFSPATGALVAGGAAVLAASWSLRSGSVAVAVSGIIGCFAMPAGVGLVRSEPRLAGLLVAVALAIGLGVHLVGGARFALARWIGAGAAALMGVPVLVTVSSPVEAFSFALCWWGLVIGQATLAAQRGIDPRGNAVLALLASAALALVEVGAWPAGAGFLGLSVIKFLPLVAGAVCLAVSLVLLPMATEPKDADEASVLGQSGMAIAVACRLLAHTLLALAIALGVGGSAFLVSNEMKPIAVIAAAAVLTWGARRFDSTAFDLLSGILGWIACIVGVALVVGQSGGGPSWRVPTVLTAGAAIDVHWSLAHLTLALATGGALAMTTAARNRVVGALLAVPAAVAWIVLAFATLDGVLVGVALALPALVVVWIPWVRGATILAAVILAGLAGLVIVVRSMLGVEGSAHTETGQLVIASSVWCTAIMLLAHRRPIGIGRARAVRIAVPLTGAAVAFVCVVVGARAGHDGLDAGFSVAIGLAVSALIAAFVGRSVRAIEVVDGAALLSAIALGVCGLLGVARLLERVPDEEGAIALELSAIAASACAAALVTLFRRAADAESPVGSGVSALAAFAVGPSIVLLLSALFGRPISPPVAVGALVLIGVAELFVGFRRDMPALRWSALVCFGLLAVRLYAVDLADASILVRIGLLFVSGMVLVATGIAYARTSRNPA
ncbi:MAG: putative rane protein [Planctomycetota bacterium]